MSASDETNAQTLLVTNPGSRSGDGAIDAAVERLRSIGEVQLVRPEQPKDLPAAIRDRADAIRRIVLGGGDGTVNLALDALIEAGLPFGLLPLGTANDLARSLDIPEDLEEAANIIVRGDTRRIDVARANDVSFVNAIGMGLGPQMTREMDAETKSRFGVLAYLIGIVRAFRRQRDFAARIESDRGRHEGRYLQVTVANGIHYGGGMTVADDARIDDGLLDVLLVRRQSRWQLLANALRFKLGQTRNADTMTHWRCGELSIETESELEVTADGEFLTCTPVDCEVIPGALTIYAPD
jgi:diacylglycerol kinase (ATP)